MAVFVGAHGFVLRSLLEDLAQVGHVLVDVLLQIDDNALLGVFQQIGIAKTGVEHEIGQGFDIGHFKRNLLAPLVALNGFPLHMDVGLLLQPLEDGAVVGLGLGARGEVGQALDGGGFCQRELQGCGINIQTGGSAAYAALAAAARQQGHSQNHCQCQ